MSVGETLQIRYNQPIPLDLPSVAGWKEVPIIENREPLVPLGIFSKHDDIFTSSIYAGEHSNSPYWREDRQLDGRLMTQFVRSEVADQLRTAQALLPKNHYLIVFDTYRSLNVQGALYEHYMGKLAAQHVDWPPEALSQETQRYVSIPSQDPSRPSPHNTGGAVDLAIFRLPPAQTDYAWRMQAEINSLRQRQFGHRTISELFEPELRELHQLALHKQAIIRHCGQLLNFGTAFDHGGEAAAANYLEHQAAQRQLDPSEQEALLNRRLLHGVMTAAGFEQYADEWWHFNSQKSQMGAKVARLAVAEYGGCGLNEGNISHEFFRRAHHQELCRIQEWRMGGKHGWPGSGYWGELISRNERSNSILDSVGDLRMSLKLGHAEVIEPPELA